MEARQSFDVSADEITVDDDGRVVISNTDLAEELERVLQSDPATRHQVIINGVCK